MVKAVIFSSFLKKHHKDTSATNYISAHTEYLLKLVAEEANEFIVNQGVLT